MSNPYQARVQQKMAHCRLLLQLITGGVAVEREHELAIVQGACIHLAIAYRLYLRELGARLNVPSLDQVYSLADLERASSGSDHGLAELRAQVWLDTLLEVERDLLNPRVDASAPQLIAVDSPRAVGALTLEVAELWFNRLEGLVERQRQSFLEY